MTSKRNTFSPFPVYRDEIYKSFDFSSRALGDGAAPSPLLTGLTRYYTLDEASGDRADSLGGPSLVQHGTVGSMAGKIGNAADFDGNAANFLQLASGGPVNGNAPFSVAYWLNGVTGCPCSHTDNVNGFDLYYNGSAVRFFSYHDSDNLQATCSAGSRLVVATWDGTTKRLYIDSAAAVTSTPGTPFATPGVSPLTVGNRNQGDLPFDGWVDALGTWSRRLSDSDAALLWSGGAGRDYPF